MVFTAERDRPDRALGWIVRARCGHHRQSGREGLPAERVQRIASARALRPGMRASSVSGQGFMPQQALGQHGKPFDALSLIHLPRQQAEVPNSALSPQNWIVFG